MGSVFSRQDSGCRMPHANVDGGVPAGGNYRYQRMARSSRG